MGLFESIKNNLKESSTEDYWNATEIARDAFAALLRFNFGTDYRGNNYIITIDCNEAERFYADSDEEAIKVYEDWKKAKDDGAVEYDFNNHYDKVVEADIKIPRNANKLTLGDEEYFKDGSYWRKTSEKDAVIPTAYSTNQLKMTSKLENKELKVSGVDENYKPNKTHEYKVIQGNYGYGWDDLVSYDAKDPEQLKQAKEDLQAYRENEPNVSHRLITRREPINEAEDTMKKRLIPTGLTDERAKDVINAVVGQLSDGIWENSPGMDKYWRFTDGLDDQGNIVVYNGYTRTYGYNNPWAYSAFTDKSDDQVKKYFATKIKQIVKEEGLDWDRDNTMHSDYLDYNSGVTVRDAYRVYDKLLGRKDYISLDEANMLDAYYSKLNESEKKTLKESVDLTNKQEVLNAFNEFIRSRYNVKNDQELVDQLEHVSNQDINDFFEDIFYDIETEEDLDNSNKAEEFVRNEYMVQSEDDDPIYEPTEEDIEEMKYWYNDSPDDLYKSKKELSPEEIVKDSWNHIVDIGSEDLTLSHILEDIVNNYTQDYFKDDTIEDSTQAINDIRYYLNNLGLDYKEEE